MNFLSRSQIVAASDLPVQVLEVPEWGGYVRIRALTGFERDAFEASVQPPPQARGRIAQMNLDNIRARLVSLCMIDEQGHRLFPEEYCEALGQKSAKALDRVFKSCQKLCGLTQEDVDFLSQTSKNGHSVDSGTDLLPSSDAA